MKQTTTTADDVQAVRRRLGVPDYVPMPTPRTMPEWRRRMLALRDEFGLVATRDDTGSVRVVPR